MKLTDYDKGLMHAARITLDDLPYQPPVSKGPAPQKPLDYERLWQDIMSVDDEDEIFARFAAALAQSEIQNERLKTWNVALFKANAQRNAELLLENERLQTILVYVGFVAFVALSAAAWGWAR